MRKTAHTFAHDALGAEIIARSQASRAPDSAHWQALRFAYAESSGFDLLGTKSAETRKAMNEALQSNDYAGALVHANLILDQNYVDIDAHVIIDIANTKLGNADEAKKHHSIVIGLLQSIRTGDGKTPETAFTVITVHEEYSLIRIFGLRRQSQALIADGGAGALTILIRLSSARLQSLRDRA